MGGGGNGKEEDWTKTTMKDKGLEEGGSKRPLGVGHNPGPGEVLHQRRKLPYSLSTMAAAGFLITASLAYFTLYSMKKPQASAKDVAKVAVGTADPNEARPSDEAARGRQGQSYYGGIMQNRRNMVAVGAVLVAATAGYYYYYYRNKKPESTASP